jgi:hypothetical protein
MVEPLEQVSEWEQTLVKCEHDFGVDAGRSWGSGAVVSFLLSIIDLQVLEGIACSIPCWSWSWRRLHLHILSTGSWELLVVIVVEHVLQLDPTSLGRILHGSIWELFILSARRSRRH